VSELANAATGDAVETATPAVPHWHRLLPWVGLALAVWLGIRAVEARRFREDLARARVELEAATEFDEVLENADLETALLDLERLMGLAVTG
jgi:hypothetical protein